MTRRGWLWLTGLGLVGCAEPGAITDVMLPSGSTPKDARPDEPNAWVGDLSDLRRRTRRAFEVTEHFGPMPPTQPGDWLDDHREPGQTVSQYLRSDANPVVAAKSVVYLLPIGELPPERGATLEELVRHAELYLGLDVRTLPELPVDALGVDQRRHMGVMQLHAGDLLDHLERRIPDDAYCVLGVTLEDLYPSDDYNYVFGYARLSARVGVFSFARYHPTFFDPAAKVDRPVVVRRAMKVMTHEILHMFGMQHCTFFRCNMNGSNHLDELDDEPAHLCPVCLRKLHIAVGFDPAARYRRLAADYRRLGLTPEADWAHRRVDYLARR